MQRSFEQCGINQQRTLQQITNSKNNQQRLSANVVVSTESPSSGDIKNTNRNTNTEDIKKVSVLGDSMVKYVQGWGITKRIYNKGKIYGKQFSGSKADCMKDYMKPCIREDNPDQLIFHVGTNNVPLKKGKMYCRVNRGFCKGSLDK